MKSLQIPVSIAAALPTLSVFDITNEVSREVASRPISSGVAYVSASSPLALIRVTEREAGFFCDLEELLARMVPVEQEQRERFVMLLMGARSEGVPFRESRLSLGTWQRVLLFGFDGDSRAEWSVSTIGC